MENVVTYRREKIEELAKVYNLTPEILAEFFQVPVKVIKNDLKTGGERPKAYYHNKRRSKNILYLSRKDRISKLCTRESKQS